MNSAREAKEFLASQIAEEAQREQVPFSEIERKMLHFSETGWTLPDIMDVMTSLTRRTIQTNTKPRLHA
jgi:hypothetical protein